MKNSLALIILIIATVIPCPFGHGFYAADFFVASAWAAERPVTFGLSQLPIWGETDPRGVVRGIEKEWTDAILEKTGMAAEFTVLPMTRKHLMEKTGDIDLSYNNILGVARGDSEIVATVAIVPYVIVARKGLRLQSLTDLQKIGSIGVLRDTKISPEFDADPSIHRVFVENHFVKLNMLAWGRLDAVVGVPSVDHAIARRLGLGDIFGESIEIGNASIALFMSKKSPYKELTSSLKEAVTTLREEGRFDLILKHYVDGPP